MTKMLTLHDLKQYKQSSKKIACLTTYDATFAKLLSESGVDMILIGDSLGCVIQGHPTTVPVTVDDIVYHTACVARGNQNAFLIADMPFMSYGTLELALKNASRLMQAGAHCVKMEGGAWLLDIVAGLTERGIPVCAHLGLTPQSVHQLGGYRVQGKNNEDALKMIKDAQLMEEKGASVLFLECVPSHLAEEITAKLTIPTIGIGAGPYCDGQVLVLYDMLGLDKDVNYKFNKNFMAEGGAQTIAGAIKSYVDEVKAGSFPMLAHSFSGT
jgi:3-methyl-2-oxobutanoate hydroxymethyltransferase